MSVIRLKKNGGYLVAELHRMDFLKAAESATAQFFSQNPTEKQAYHRTDFEHGYFSSSEKELFLIRDNEMPKILDPCRDYLDYIYDFTKQCLAFIATEMGWPPEHLYQLIDDAPLPTDQLANSVLGGFQYHGGQDVGVSTAEHQDLGLLTILPRSNISALEIYDFDQEGKWINIENQLQENELLVMFGETLTLITNGKLIPATHRVQKTQLPRTALVYRVRAKPEALLDANLFENPVSITAETFINNERSKRTSVNGLY